MNYLDLLPPPDRLSLEVGLGLIPLVCDSLIPQLTDLRRVMGLECDIDVPPIRVRDNAALEPKEYLVRVYGTEAARGTLADSHAPILKHLAKVIRCHAAELAQEPFA